MRITKHTKKIQLQREYDETNDKLKDIVQETCLLPFELLVC